MKWLIITLAMPTAALAQTIPNIDAARAAAKAVDLSTQQQRTGRESMDRTAPLLTVEPHKDPAVVDEKAWRKARKAEAKQKLETPPAELKR